MLEDMNSSSRFLAGPVRGTAFGVDDHGVQIGKLRSSGVVGEHGKRGVVGNGI